VADPDYSLAPLLVELIGAAVPPAELERIFHQATELRPSSTKRVRRGA
jgi:hypothetical protein